MTYSHEVRSQRNQPRNAGHPSELELLTQIRTRARRFTAGGLKVGIGDDCALIRPRAAEEWAVTTDLSIEGRHFRMEWHPPEAVGHRVLARGLSDLAAMGARPVAAFLSLGLPGELTRASGRRPAWVERFFDGLFALAETYRVPLAGGDLAESPVAVADIVLVGAAPRGKALLRSGARAGDQLFVTGSLGGAAVGLARLAELAGSATGRRWQAGFGKRMEAGLSPHLYPQPRVAQGGWLVRHGLATAALDLSDGLSTDLAHLCQESCVAAEVDAPALPVAEGATLEQALNGGEDYELLFTAPAGVRMPRAIAGVAVTRIGRIVRPRRGRPQVVLVTAEGKEALKPRGWEHFS
jgi:thiamine-monophosphate kinase